MDNYLLVYKQDYEVVKDYKEVIYYDEGEIKKDFGDVSIELSDRLLKIHVESDTRIIYLGRGGVVEFGTDDGKVYRKILKSN